MNVADYGEVIELLQGQPGIVLREADSREAMARYLDRNPGLSFVAEQDGRLVSSVMSGHDGRRGYLFHLMVDPSFRRQGVGRRLVEACLEKLRALQIFKVHLDVLVDNPAAALFWERLGWQRRNDIAKYSFIAQGGTNA